PGNVRELRSTMRRAAVLADRLQIEPEDLALLPVVSEPETRVEPRDTEAVASPPGRVAAPPDLYDLNQTLSEARGAFVSWFVSAALKQHGECREAAAAALGISVRSLYRYVSRRGRGDPVSTSKGAQKVPGSIN